MAERKWGAIASGATFEALATTIVFFEDPMAALFGRRGKDGGQDARSGDGTRVFQAKHHQDGSAAAAIRDAKKEAATIQGYRQPGHARYDQWKGVTHWRLITNAAFNPTDKQTWDTEVVPLFAAQGLVADYWERENLNGLLDKYPEIHRSFFENETRAFLSVPEVRERLPVQEPFLRRDELGSFCGREAELAEVRAFLASPPLFLVVHGAGGMGKTRLLVEAGEAIAREGNWQVLWANVASMSATGSWFESMVPERPTLLLIDEPTDEAVLQQLSEQLGGRVGRTAHWKVAVAVRSPNDPVLRFLFGARMKSRVRELAIGALLEADAEAMCDDLLKSGKRAALPQKQRREAARELSRRFARHPVWLTLAIQLLEDRGDLTKVPETAKDLANEYLKEVEHRQSDFPPEQVRDLLRWVALVGTVNREDDNTIKLLGDGSGAGGITEVRRELASLVSRRVLTTRGARNRFVELKPDVLRDHVLLNWLSADVGFGNQPVVASDQAKQLIETLRGPAASGTLSGIGRSILASLARTELLLDLSGHAVPLLAGFFQGLRAALSGMTASQRLALANVLEAIAFFQPIATAEIVGALRNSAASEERIEGIFSTRVIGQNDVVLSLAWPLFHAAEGAHRAEAQETVLRELCALTEAEAEVGILLKRGLPNDGKRAAALVARVLEGGPHFWSSFDETAKTLGEELLNELARQSPTPGKNALLKALVQPAIAIERRRTWADDDAIHVQTFVIGPEDPAWSTRAALLTRIKELLSDDTTPVSSRVALWHLFAATHNNVNQVHAQAKPNGQRYDEMLLADLVWAREILARRNAGVEELSAARELWDWHRRFGSDLHLKATSDELEALYAANGLASEFEPLLGRADWDQREPRMTAKAAALATAQTPHEIEAFLERAVVFLGGEQHLDQVLDVAWSLGKLAPDNEVVRRFAKLALQRPTVSPWSDFGAVIAASWVATVRKSEHAEQTAAVVSELLIACGSDEQRANLLMQIYGRVPKPQSIGEFSAAEHTLLRGQSQLFIATGRAAGFVGAIAQTIDHDWAGLRPLLEGVLGALSAEMRPAALRSLTDGLYWALRKAEDPSKVPAGLGEWLLNQLLLIPDFDDLGGNVEWYLEELFKNGDRVHVSWLPRALTARKNLEAERNGDRRARAVGHHSRFSRYVQRIVAADVGDSEVVRAIEALLAWAEDDGSIGYHLPEILQDIDPEGIVVPPAVANFASNSDSEHVRRMARIGHAYVVGTAAWRTIAKAAIVASSKQGADAQRAIFSALGDGQVRSWSGRRGEVPELFVSAVESARAALASETDADLRPFWQWRLAIAEAELREQEELAKEERGE